MEGQAPQQLPVSSDGAALAQILLQLGSMSTDVAIIKEKLHAVPDHEQRIRTLEASTIALKAKLWAGSFVISLLASGGAAWVALLVSHR